MLTDEQRAILQELKKRNLNSEQQLIVAELEKRDFAPQEKSVVQKSLDVLNTPARGMAGLAVGAERLLRPSEKSLMPGSSIGTDQVMQMIQGAPNALNRAAAATQPGFQPQDLRERIMSEGAQNATNTLLAEGAGVVISKGAPIIKSALGKVGTRLIKGKATQRIEELRNLRQDLPEIQLEREKQFEQLRQLQGKEIEQAREAAQVPQQMMDVSNIDKDYFANLMKAIKPTPTKMNLPQMMRLRDRADAVIRSGVDKTQRAMIRSGMNRIDQALERFGEEGKRIGSSYKNYGRVERAAEAVPEDFMKRKNSLAKSIRSLQSEADLEKWIRKLALTGLGAGVLGKTLIK